MKKLIVETRNAVVEALDCAENCIDVLKTVVEYQITVTFLFEDNKKDITGFDVIADIVNGAVRSLKHIPILFDDGVKTVISTAIVSSAYVCDDVYTISYKASFGAITGASCLGEDIGATAVNIVKEAVRASTIFNVETSRVLEGAVTGVLHAAGKIGSDVALNVRDALVSKISLPVDLVENAAQRSLL